MSRLQITFIAVMLTAAIGAGSYEAHQASKLLEQVQTLRQRQAPFVEQIRHLVADGCGLGQSRADGARS